MGGVTFRTLKLWSLRDEPAKPRNHVFLFSSLHMIQWTSAYYTPHRQNFFTKTHTSSSFFYLSFPILPPSFYFSPPMASVSSTLPGQVLLLLSVFFLPSYLSWGHRIHQVCQSVLRPLTWDLFIILSKELPRKGIFLEASTELRLIIR